MPPSAAQLEARQALLKRGIWTLVDKGEPLEAILRQLIANIEGQSERMLAAIFFYDPETNTLTVGAAPNLQPSYQAAVNGFQCGPKQPACGSAVFRRQRVVCADVRTDPLWVDLLPYAEGAGFRAVWSQPIFADDETVIGTIAFYFPTPKEPDDADCLVMEIAASVVAAAVKALAGDDT